jgi:CRP/FNR family cyclic AMP-dependent transcriptional regulator
MFFGFPHSNNPRLQLLKNVVLFKDLSMRDLAMVDSLMHNRSYLAEEVIFDEGEEGQGLFVVLSGRVKITLPANVDTVLIELGPGAFFGEVALLDQSVRTAQARAIEDTKIVALFRAEFYSLLETHSSIATALWLPVPSSGWASSSRLVFCWCFFRRRSGSSCRCCWRWWPITCWRRWSRWRCRAA